MPYLWFGLIFYFGINDMVGWIIVIHAIAAIIIMIIDVVKNDSILMEVFDTFYGALTDSPKESKNIDSMILYVLSLDKREENDFELSRKYA